ncbi:uncharacterized protein PO2_contig-113-17, partial [Mycobacterium sp. PO2]
MQSWSARHPAVGDDCPQRGDVLRRGPQIAPGMPLRPPVDGMTGGGAITGADMTGGGAIAGGAAGGGAIAGGGMTGGVTGGGG